MIIDDDRTDETDKMILWRWNEGRAIEGIIASVFEHDPRYCTQRLHRRTRRSIVDYWFSSFGPIHCVVLFKETWGCIEFELDAVFTGLGIFSLVFRANSSFLVSKIAICSWKRANRFRRSLQIFLCQSLIFWERKSKSFTSLFCKERWEQFAHDHSFA